MGKIKVCFIGGIILLALAVCYWAEWQILRIFFAKFLPWLYSFPLGRDILRSQIFTAMIFYVFKKD